MAPKVEDVVRRKLVFVGGKGGVGKTAVSQAISLGLARSGKRTLWATFEDPTRPQGVLEPRGPNLWHLNCEASLAFEEYAAMKIRVPGLTKLFLQNKLMRYLSKAAPGIHELVLLGKIWFERLNYDHVVVDMPSTGYGLAMFQSTANFSKAFSGGPIYHDAEAMLRSFHDARETGHLIVSLPEEMPLQESLELNGYLMRYFPDNPAAFVVNRRFPRVGDDAARDPEVGRWESPLAKSAEDYARKRTALEAFNLRLWDGIPWGQIEFVPPSPTNSASEVADKILSQIQAQRWLA